MAFNTFQRLSSYWVKYDDYEIVKSDAGIKYIKPKDNAKPIVYDPLKDAEALVVDALNVGMLQMSGKDSKIIQTALLDFVHKYGLIGFMTALPTTPKFIEYKAVYLPKNHFIKEETMTTEDFLSLFFPFKQLDFHKKGKESTWEISGDNDIIALSMTFMNEPQAMNMSFQRDYCENYEWLLTHFKDLAFTLVTSYLYYEDFEDSDELTKELYQKGMAAFGSVAPTYHIALYDKPTIVWDFHSLALGIQMMFSFILTDEKKPLRVCRQCEKAFIAPHPKSVFCTPQCKNQHNVYKSRNKE